MDVKIAYISNHSPLYCLQNMTWICHCSAFIPGEHLPLSAILTQKSIISPLLGTGTATGTARVQEQLNTAFLHPSGKFPSGSKLCIFSPTHVTFWDKQGTTWDLIVSRSNSSRTNGHRKDGKQAKGCIFSFLSAYKGLCVCWGGDGRGEGERGAGTVKFEGEKSLYIWISGVLGPSKIVKIPFFE